MSAAIPDDLTINTGYLPHRYQALVHESLARFSVLVCHRRWGKTVCAVNALVDAALKSTLSMPRFAYVAPLRIQAKGIAWDYFKLYCGHLPGVKINESELKISFEHNGATIRLYGADNPDAMRGFYFDGVVMDEVADMKPDTWDAVVRPCLTDRKGWCLFIGTPKGMNKFYQLYMDALQKPGWFARVFSVTDTLAGLCEDVRHPWSDAFEIEESRADMSDAKFRQEWYCDFTASLDNVMIPLDLVEPARGKHLQIDQYMGAPKILGVDVARFGDDRSCILFRQGLAVLDMQIYKKLDNMELTGRIVTAIREHEPDAVFIDGGRGEGVIDRLRELGFAPIEVKFGGSPLQAHRYINKRAEMWDSAKEWFELGGAIPDDQQMVASLVAPEYFYDSLGRIGMEKKEDMKKRIGFSPDPADALCLTFAFPVQSKLGGLRSLQTGKPHMANNEYDVLAY